MPPVPPGMRPPRLTMQVGAHVDAGNQIQESNDNNNIAAAVTVACGG
jgi:hypothetical protein